MAIHDVDENAIRALLSAERLVRVAFAHSDTRRSPR